MIQENIPGSAAVKTRVANNVILPLGISVMQMDIF